MYSSPGGILMFSRGMDVVLEYRAGPVIINYSL